MDPHRIVQLLSPLLECRRRGPFPRAALPCRRTDGADDGAACADRRTKKGGGTSRSRRSS